MGKLQDLLAEVKKLDEEATKGPWVQNFMHVVRPHGSDGAHFAAEPEICDTNVGHKHSNGELACVSELCPGLGRVSYCDNGHANAAFISRARTLLPKLAEIVEFLQDEIVTELPLAVIRQVMERAEEIAK